MYVPTTFSLSILYLFFLFLLILYLPPAIGEPLYNICGGSSNFSANSTYQTNLNSLLSTLASKTQTTGFSNTTVGQIPEQVYGLAMCRGDVNATICLSCLQDANRDALQLCPYDREGTVWYDYCLLRYSNLNFLSISTFNNSLIFWMWNTANATDATRFNQLINDELSVVTAIASNSPKRFATEAISYYTADNPIIYGLVQCTPDMSVDNCSQCLKELFKGIPTNQLNGKQGGRMVGLWCYMRYEVYKFFDGNPTYTSNNLVIASTPPPIPPTPIPPVPIPAQVPTSVTTAAASVSTKPSGKKVSTGVILAIAISSATILLSAICFWFWRLATEVPSNHGSDKDDISSVESLLVDASMLRNATNDFSDDNKLGEGGFGVVFKGRLPDGQEIAVKKLSTSSDQGLQELKNELVLVAKLQHRNLVRLLGVCLQEEKSIVYEYVPNKSLDKFLFDPLRRVQLHWGIRYKIINGIARGLLYLHEESQLKVVHRDLKASNVLLDSDMNPKISDFGLAKLVVEDKTQGSTNRIVGTFGYMAPEYVMHGRYSNKSDIFSFGILVLEIVTGKKNSDSGSELGDDLLSNIWEKWCNGTIIETLDPTLGNHYPRSEVLRVIQIGLLCVQENPLDRPNISSIILMLNRNTVSLKAPSRPAFLFGMTAIVSEGSFVSEDVESSNKALLKSRNDCSITELDPR